MALSPFCSDFFFFSSFFLVSPVQHNVTCLDVPMGSECLVDAGDRLRYCVNVSRTDDGFSTAFNISIDDDLRLIYQRSNLVFAPSTIGFTLSPPIVGTDATELTGHRGLPTGIFTGPQATTGVNDVCFVIADGGISAAESSVFQTSVPNDALRRVRLSEPNVGQITNIGNLGTTDVEAMAINATSSPFTLFAMNGAVLGFLDLQGVNPVTSVQSDFVSGGARRFNNLFVRIGAVGSVRYWTRGNVNNVNLCDELCSTSTTFASATVNTADIDSLTMFPYAPYELWGAARVGNLDVLFRLDAATVGTCRATSGGCTTTTLVAQNTFGTNNGDGVEVYSRLINDYENSRDRRGILLPGQRPIILDIDDMAFTGNQPPKLFAIANQGSDPGALVTVFYYSGSFQPNNHAYLPVCSTAACGNTEMKRAGAPGTVELKGAFGTPDFEGMSFSPDGRLHMSTGKDSVPCLPALTDNSTDVAAGTPANSFPGGNCGVNDACSAGFFCVQPERYCVALPATSCAAGNLGCACDTALSGNLQCGSKTDANAGVADGRRARCALLEDQENVLSTTPFSVGRCVNNANCFATDNFLWQVDPQTGRLLEQQNFFLLERDSAFNNGDYEAIACNTQNPVLDVGPSSLSFCYTARVTNIAPAGILNGGSVLQSRISSKVSNVFACSPNGNRLRVSAVDQTPLLSPPLAPAVVVSASSDPCTGSSMVASTMITDVQIGETFELSVTARLPEGTTYSTLLGVRVPAGFDTARVVLVSTAFAAGCEMTFTTGNSPNAPTGFRSISVGQTGAFDYLVLDYGDVLNRWDKTCGGTMFNAKDAQDDLTARITLRMANVTANVEGATIDFTPVILFKHMNPGGTDSPVTQPGSWASLISTFPLLGSPLRIQVREPLMPLTHTIQGTSATTFREGETLRLCASSTVQRVCAHDPDIRFDWTTPPATTCAVFTGTPTVTAPTPAGCVLRTAVGTSPPTVHCNNVLQVGESVSYCYNVRLECPPTPTPPPPTPPPTPFPSCIVWETNPDNGPPDTFPGEREYQNCETVTINVRPRVRLGNFVWSDDDRDGVQDAGEAGINGVLVELLSGTTVIATVLTAGNGAYEFSSLTTLAMLPNTAYSIRIQTTVGNNNALVGTRILTTQDAPAAGDLLDSDASPGGTVGAVATITPATTGADGSFVDSFDFGFQPPLADSLLGNFVWLDFDGDGIQDAGESGIQGVDLNLIDVNGNVRASTTTTAAWASTRSRTRAPRRLSTRRRAGRSTSSRSRCPTRCSASRRRPSTRVATTRSTRTARRICSPATRVRACCRRRRRRRQRPDARLWLRAAAHRRPRVARQQRQRRAGQRRARHRRRGGAPVRLGQRHGGPADDRQQRQLLLHDAQHGAGHRARRDVPRVDHAERQQHSGQLSGDAERRDDGRRHRGDRLGRRRDRRQCARRAHARRAGRARPVGPYRRLWLLAVLHARRPHLARHQPQRRAGRVGDDQHRRRRRERAGGGARQHRADVGDEHVGVVPRVVVPGHRAQAALGHRLPPADHDARQRPAAAVAEQPGRQRRHRL
jgi:hypothetical protein